MFRQIMIEDHHHPFQMILWCFKDSDPIQAYKLNTVTYGMVLCQQWLFSKSRN